MSHNKEDPESLEEEFVFDDSEKLNLSKYNGLKSFYFGPTLYFLTPEGEKIVQLMQYFKEYYKNLKN